MPSPPRPSDAADQALRLVRASAAEQRLVAAADWLGHRAEGRVLLLSASRGAADSLLRRRVDYTSGPATRDGNGNGNGVFGVHRLTPRQLAAELATRRLAMDEVHPVHGLALEALAARAVDGCLEREEISYFEPVAELPGMARATLRTLLELRGAGFSADTLRLSDRPPVRDLGYLLAAYERSLREASVIDPPGVLRVAAEVCEDPATRHDLLGLPLLLLDLTPASGAEIDLLSSLLKRSGDVLATVVEGDAEGLDALRDRLGLAEDAAEDRTTESRLGRLRQRIFSDASKQDTAEDDEEESDDSFLFFAAAGEGREAVEIARKLVQSARTGRPFDQTAIALRDPITYLPLVEEALARARIPAHFSRGTVRPDPAGRAFLALLACADERLSASRFAEYLSLDQAPDPDDEGAPPEVEVPWIEPDGEQLVFKTLVGLPSEMPSDSRVEVEDEGGEAQARRLVTPRQWERLLVDAAVIEGKERWRRRLEGVAAELRLQLRHLDDDDETERRRIAVEMTRLENLRRFALPLVDELDALPRTSVWGSWRRALEALASRALREPERVLRTLAELRPMDDVGPVALDEVRRVLETRLLELRAEPDGRRHGKVWVGTIDELRGRSFHTVFLPGLAEGRFPRRPTEDPLLLDSHRRALDEASKVPSSTVLPTKDTIVERERLLLRLAVGAAGMRLVTSYPSLDTLEGRPKVPSFYALDLLRAAEGRLPDLRRLERRAVAASSSRLGWPAPIRSDDAIDDAEFDLATLLDLLVQKDGDVTGQGRYLLEVNEPLRRALRHRYCRWNLNRKMTPADGLVAGKDDEAMLAVLQEHRLAERAYSPTALQNYAICPLRFAYQAILRLRPRDRPERLEQLDPLTRGSLFHEVQFELLSALRDDERLGLLRGRSSTDGTGDRDGDGEGDELLQRADAALDHVAARYEEELAPAVPRVWRAELEGLRIDLRGWLQAVRSADDGFVPERFELAFGLGERHLRRDHHDPSSSTEEAMLEDGWRLRGSIDLVERHDSGELRVTDHKTGKVPDTARSGTRVGRGELLQPLLYAQVARQRLDAPVRSGRLFYCTRRGEFQSVDVPLDEDGRDALDVVLDTIDGAVAHGALPAAPKDGACRWCDYRMICGPREESRTARKQDDMLRPLRRVRSMP